MIRVGLGFRNAETRVCEDSVHMRDSDNVADDET